MRSLARCITELSSAQQGILSNAFRKLHRTTVKNVHRASTSSKYQDGVIPTAPLIAPVIPALMAPIVLAATL